MYRFFMIVCLAAALLAACQGSHKTKEALLQEGKNQLDAGKPSAAIVILKNALEKDQSFFDARLNLSRAYLAAGKTDSAEKELEKLVRQQPNSRDVHIEIARMNVQKNRPDEALKELAGIKMTQTGGDTDVLEIRGVAYAIKKDFPAATASLKQALEAGPVRISALLSLAKVYAVENRFQEAKAQIAEALKRQPENKAAFDILVAIQTDEGDIDGALKTCDTRLKIDSNDLRAYYQKGLLYERRRNYEKALEAADEIVARSSNSPEGHLLRGIILFQMKKTADAEVSLQKSLALRPTVDAHYYLALAQYDKKEIEQAIGNLRQAVDMQPAFGQGRAVLAAIFAKQNKLDDAIKEAKKAVEADRDNAFAYNILGTVCFAKGLIVEGEAALNRAIELDPKLVDTYVKKGLFYISKGQYFKGETELTTALRINPDFLNSRLVLASYYQQHGEHDKALRILKEGLKGDASDAVLYNLMAESLIRRNMIAEAVECYRKAATLNPTDEHASLRLATVYVAQGDSNKAIQEIEAFIKHSPDHVHPLTMLAALKEARGDDRDAAAYYKQARETGEPEGFIEEAHYWLRKNDSNEAISVIDKAIKKYPSNAFLHEFKGKIYASRKQYSDAIDAFKELEKLNQKMGFPYLIKTYLAMGQPQKALDKIAGEIQKNPSNLELKAELSRVYSTMGKKQQAVDNAREIIRTAPGTALGYLVLAEAYRAGNEPAEAIVVLKNSRVKDASLPLMLGTLYYGNKDYPAALSQFSKAYAMKAGYVPALVQKGVTLQAMRRNAEAAVEYQRALSMSPNDVMALNNLAYIQATDNHDMRHALQYAVRAYLLAPGDGAINDTLGFLLLKNGKIEEGLKTLKKAATLLPDNASIRYHLGLAYRESGDTGHAIEWLRKSLDLGEFPDQREARNLLEKLEKEKRS